MNMIESNKLLIIIWILADPTYHKIIQVTCVSHHQLQMYIHGQDWIGLYDKNEFQMHMAQVLSVRDLVTYPLYLIPQQWAHGQFPNTVDLGRKKKMV